MEKKLTPIAKAVEEIEMQMSSAVGLSANNYNAGLLKAIKILEGLKDYERDEFVITFEDGFNDVNGLGYFYDTYTQEGGSNETK